MGLSSVGFDKRTLEYARKWTSEVHTSFALGGNRFRVFISSCPPTFRIKSVARVCAPVEYAAPSPGIPERTRRATRHTTIDPTMPRTCPTCILRPPSPAPDDRRVQPHGH